MGRIALPRHIATIDLRRDRVGVCIIHLIRRNALDVVLSKEAGAAREGRLHARDGEDVEAVRLNLDTGDLGAAGFRLDLLPAPH